MALRDAAPAPVSPLSLRSRRTTWWDRHSVGSLGGIDTRWDRSVGSTLGGIARWDRHSVGSLGGIDTRWDRHSVGSTLGAACLAPSGLNRLDCSLATATRKELAFLQGEGELSSLSRKLLPGQLSALRVLPSEGRSSPSFRVKARFLPSPSQSPLTHRTPPPRSSSRQAGSPLLGGARSPSRHRPPDSTKPRRGSRVG